MKIRLGTRGSKLALWHANFTQRALHKIGVDSALVVIEAQEDLEERLRFGKIDGKRFFSKEMEAALLGGEIDVAVHAMQDLPVLLPENLAITAVSCRHNPSELLLMHPDALDKGQIFGLKKEAIVGASTNLRKVQMLDFRSDVTILDVDGTESEHIEHLRKGNFDAILLSAVGVQCLNLDVRDLEQRLLNPKEFVPAPAQGVLAWLTNKQDTDTRMIFKQLHQSLVSACTNVERKVQQLMDDGHPSSLGVYCERDEQGNYHTFAVCQIDGQLRRARLSSATNMGMAEALVRGLRG